MDYSWAINKTKLHVAESKVRQFQAESGKGLTEENVKEWYIKLGGLVVKEIKKPGRPRKEDNVQAPTMVSQTAKVEQPRPSVDPKLPVK